VKQGVTQGAGVVARQHRTRFTELMGTFHWVSRSGKEIASLRSHHTNDMAEQEQINNPLLLEKHYWCNAPSSSFVYFAGQDKKHSPETGKAPFRKYLDRDGTSN